VRSETEQVSNSPHYISKISLSSGGLLAIPLNLRCAPFFASFFLKKKIQFPEMFH